MCMYNVMVQVPFYTHTQYCETSESVARLCGHSTGIPPTREIVDYSCTVVGTSSPEEHLKHLIKCQFSFVSCF